MNLDHLHTYTSQSLYRKRLINLELRAQEEAQGIGGAVPQISAAERILAEQAKLNVAAVELEKKRLAKMQAKKAKEIEQVGGHCLGPEVRAFTKRAGTRH